MGDDLAEGLNNLSPIQSREHMGSGVRLDHKVSGLDLRALVVDLLELSFLLQSFLHLVAVDSVRGEAAVSAALPARYDSHTVQIPTDVSVRRLPVVSLVHGYVGDLHPDEVLDVLRNEPTVMLLGRNRVGVRPRYTKSSNEV